jgi:acyl carrier protein
MEEKLLVDIEERIKKILTTDLEVDTVSLKMCDSQTPLLGRGIGLDSVETLILVAGIERAYSLHIEDDDLTVDLFRSIRTLAEYVFNKVSGP